MMEFKRVTGLTKECSGVKKAECAIKQLPKGLFEGIGARAVGELQMKVSSAIDQEPIPQSNPTVQGDKCAACGKMVLTISDESGPLAVYTTPVD
jgi:hypothetical protein